MKTMLFFLMIAATLCRAQDPSWEFLCEGHSNWVSSIKFFTTVDRIRFIGPLDRFYSNACEAQQYGDVRLIVDSIQHSIELRVDPSDTGRLCPRNWAPVYSVAVEFGPLIEGDWVFWSSAYQFTNFFTVYPDPGPADLRGRIENGMFFLEWPIVAYRSYELEASADLTSWHSAQVIYSADDSVMSAKISLETQSQFFRVKQSPITQAITSYPNICF